MTDAALVRLEHDDGIAVVILARSGMQNALVPELLDALLDVLAQVAADSTCRAVLLRAEGAAFSIGGDMRRFQRERQGDLLAYSRNLVGKLNQAILALLDLPQPVVAAVHGVVTGGSIGLVLAADLMVLAPEVVFKAHYATAGFSPDGGWTVILPARIGHGPAAAGLLLNRSIRAEEALALGMATAVVPAADLQAEAHAMAAKVAAYPAGTMRAAKRLLNLDRERIAQGLEAERQAFLELITRPEALAGVDDFLRRFTTYPTGE